MISPPPPQLTMPTAVLHLLTNYDVKQHQISQTGCLTGLYCWDMRQTWHPNGQTSCPHWHLLLLQHTNYTLGLSHLQLLQSRCQLITYLFHHVLHLVRWRNWTVLLVSQTPAHSQIPGAAHLHSVWHHLQQWLYLHITISNDKSQNSLHT